MQENRAELRAQYGVQSIAVFGSVARDEAGTSSDVDELVEFDDRPIGYLHLGGLHFKLTRLLQTNKIDLVLRSAVIPSLREQILGEAIGVDSAEVAVSH